MISNKISKTNHGKKIFFMFNLSGQTSYLAKLILQNMIRKAINHRQKPFYLKNNLFLPSVSIFLDKTGHSGIPKFINL